MKTIVINEDKTWASLICPYCKKELDYFHSECLFDKDKCPYCNGKLEKSEYQEKYDKMCEEIEKER